jgi:glycosyl transferase family 25
MRTFLVNLERRPDRLAAMAAQLARLGLPFERFDAVDAKTVAPDVLGAPFAETGPLGMLSPGDKACTYSHIHIWRMIADGPDEYATVLEDDIVLTDSAPRFLLDDEWIPRQAGLIKLERYGDKNQLIVLGNPRLKVLDREIAPLLSRHTGTGGYIISRPTATRLARIEQKIALPVDHLLFNPNNSPMFDALKPWQLLPAILDQQEVVGGATDIHRTREATRPKGMALIRRQLRRNYYDLRLVPRQMAQVLTGRGRVTKIPITGTEELSFDLGTAEEQRHRHLVLGRLEDLERTVGILQTESLMLGHNERPQEMWSSNSSDVDALQRTASVLAEELKKPVPDVVVVKLQYEAAVAVQERLRSSLKDKIDLGTDEFAKSLGNELGKSLGRLVFWGPVLTALSGLIVLLEQWFRALGGH